jgi:hypothetical protein
MTGLRDREVASRMSRSRMSEEAEKLRNGIAENLAREMEARGVSVGDLAEATKIPEEALERILRAEVEMIMFLVPWLAEALGARPGDLFDGWDG